MKWEKAVKNNLPVTLKSFFLPPVQNVNVTWVFIPKQRKEAHGRKLFVCLNPLFSSLFCSVSLKLLMCIVNCHRQRLTKLFLSITHCPCPLSIKNTPWVMLICCFFCPRRKWVKTHTAPLCQCSPCCGQRWDCIRTVHCNRTLFTHNNVEQVHTTSMCASDSPVWHKWASGSLYLLFLAWVRQYN